MSGVHSSGNGCLSITLFPSMSVFGYNVRHVRHGSANDFGLLQEVLLSFDNPDLNQGRVISKSTADRAEEIKNLDQSKGASWDVICIKPCSPQVPQVMIIVGSAS